MPDKNTPVLIFLILIYSKSYSIEEQGEEIEISKRLFVKNSLLPELPQQPHHIFKGN